MTHAPAELPTVTGLTVRAVDVPLVRPVRTASGLVSSAPLVLVDLHTDRGLSGAAYVFAYAPAALRPLAQFTAGLTPLLAGEALAPAALDAKLRRAFRLLGTSGLVGMALAAVDMAAWDALAKVAALPLAVLLGAKPVAIPAYASLGSMTADELEREAGEATRRGFRAIKIRLGLSDLAHDLDTVRAVRGAVGDGVAIMADYNQSLTAAEAVARCRALDAEGLAWIEEPVRADDHLGHAAVAAAAATPVQTGENWWGPQELALNLAAGASDLVMLDAMKIGGVTGWMRAAALADSAGKPVSSHIFVEFSRHLLSATPTRHWCEYLDLAGPILKSPAGAKDGMIEPSFVPGAGIEWDEAALAQNDAELF